MKGQIDKISGDTTPVEEYRKNKEVRVVRKWATLLSVDGMVYYGPCVPEIYAAIFDELSELLEEAIGLRYTD